MGRKGKESYDLQTIGTTPNFILQMKQNIQRQNMESQKTSFNRFLEKAGYEGEERAEAMKKFMDNYDKPDMNDQLIHDIDDKNEETKLMKAGFNIVDNQQSVLDEQRKQEELSKFIPGLNSNSQYSEIGSKRDTDIAANLKKNQKPIFVRKNKQEEDQSDFQLGKRRDHDKNEANESFNNNGLKQLKIGEGFNNNIIKKKINKAVLSFNQDE